MTTSSVAEVLDLDPAARLACRAGRWSPPAWRRCPPRPRSRLRLQRVLGRAGQSAPGTTADVAGDRQRLQHLPPIVVASCAATRPRQVQHVEKPELHRHRSASPGPRPWPRPGSSAAAAGRSWCGPSRPARRSRRPARRCARQQAVGEFREFRVGVGEVVAGSAVQAAARVVADCRHRPDAVPLPLEPPGAVVGEIRDRPRRSPASA